MKQTSHFQTMPWQDLSVIDRHSDTPHIFLIAFENFYSHLKLLQSLLSRDECVRAERLQLPVKRQHFTITRSLMRALLGYFMDLSPEALTFNYGEHGKPTLIDSDLEFNVSHDKDYAVVAVNWHKPIGIDVEFTGKHLEYLGLAKRFFSKYEYQTLLALPVEQHATAFFNVWTRKEAFIKAIGLGLYHALDSFDVSLGADAELMESRDEKIHTNDWFMRAVDIDQEHKMAIACQKNLSDCHFFQLC